MKKLLLTAIIAALLVMPLEGVAMAQNPETASPQAQDFIPGGVPAETDALESMTPAVHAMVLAMLHHNLTVFDGKNTDLSWETLYNMLSLYGQLDERSEYLNEDLILPVETVMDFSSALFPSFEALGQLPGGLSDRMVYAPDIDSYRLVCGNDSLAQIELESSQQFGAQLQVTGALVYQVDGSDLARFQATLQYQDNLFGYRITGLELL